jgi:hypothetical protein
VVELRPNSQLLVPYLDTSSDISSFHDESQDSISSESTSSNSEFEVRRCECVGMSEMLVFDGIGCIKVIFFKCPNPGCFVKIFYYLKGDT